MPTRLFCSWHWIALSAILIQGCNGQKNAPTDFEGIPDDAVVIFGAGSTFTAPLYEKWLNAYRKTEPSVFIKYDPTGSGEGVARFLEEKLDYAGSDAALSDEDIAKVKQGVTLIPMTAGSIVLAYNLPGVESELKLSRSVYTDIFLGKITLWNDPRIRALNPGVELPEQEINVVARRDSSGTTYVFTNHLHAISESWRAAGLEPAKLINWPGETILAGGNEGVAGLIEFSPGAIGYVEYGVARRAELKMASLENREGKFVRPGGESGRSTLVSTELPSDFRVYFPDPNGLNSYPIVTYSWLLVYNQYRDDRIATELKKYLVWCLTEGQALSEELGYIPLAPEVVDRVLEAVGKIQ